MFNCYIFELGINSIGQLKIEYNNYPKQWQILNKYMLRYYVVIRLLLRFKFQVQKQIVSKLWPLIKNDPKHIDSASASRPKADALNSRLVSINNRDIFIQDKI